MDARDGNGIWNKALKDSVLLVDPLFILLKLLNHLSMLKSLEKSISGL